MVLERVQKIIANSGYCSRRKAEELILKGKVTVNNKVITIGDKADYPKDIIRVDGKIILKPRLEYIMLHKPKGYITTVKDKYNRRTVMELVDIPGIKPVGRLDRDSEGLLLFTNDGKLANRLMHPRYMTNKTYHIKLDKPITQKDIRSIEQGVKLKDGKSARSKIVQLDKKTVNLTIHEGRNKIVKRIFSKQGYNVNYLKRIAINNLQLGSLPKGKTRRLTQKEIDSLKKSAGI